MRISDRTGYYLYAEATDYLASGRLGLNNSTSSFDMLLLLGVLERRAEGVRRAAVRHRKAQFSTALVSRHVTLFYSSPQSTGHTCPPLDFDTVVSGS